jgi:hypothetical protein
MVLQQCAHFYNNIATEMIPCQKPLMLADAVEFEKVSGKNHSIVSWVHFRIHMQGCMESTAGARLVLHHPPPWVVVSFAVVVQEDCLCLICPFSMLL